MKREELQYGEKYLNFLKKEVTFVEHFSNQICTFQTKTGSEYSIATDWVLKYYTSVAKQITVQITAGETWRNKVSGKTYKTLEIIDDYVLFRSSPFDGGTYKHRLQDFLKRYSPPSPWPDEIYVSFYTDGSTITSLTLGEAIRRCPTAKQHVRYTKGEGLN